MPIPTRDPSPVTERVFVQRFSSTSRGARLARLLALRQLEEWGHEHGCALSDAAAVLVAELAANAATHGRIPGRDFQVVLRLRRTELRIEVSDTKGEARPAVRDPEPTAVAGRGMQLVTWLADEWGVTERPMGKTVWAVLALPPAARP